MKKAVPIIIIFLIIIVFLIIIMRNDREYTREIEVYQEEMNREMKGQESPFPLAERLEFEKLEFYPVSKKYKVEARFEKFEKDSVFEMKTNTDRLPLYRKYGTAYFKLNGKNLSLAVYQNLDLINRPQYEDFLFLPFKDLTNGKETYGAGRYMDLKIPDEETIVLDFNKVYNPYCAYNHDYSCPIPPFENHLDVEVRAGVKKYH